MDLLLRGKVDGVDDGSDQLGADVPNIPKLYYMLGRESMDESDSESSNEDSQKSSVLRDRFPLPRTIVKRDTGRRYTYTGASSKNSGEVDTTMMNKRGPGSILTWALSAKRPLLQSDMRQ
ncbi:hypothetical protein C0J52_02619 [Blattella germanica]|nr:hypothetical protein C0J52_02619 [Blattella germanica]